MSYKKLEIWQLSKSISNEIHRMSLEDLPKFEVYEEASQIRRSAKSIRSNIVEGYGRRRYKAEFIRFLIFSFSSCLETQDHLEILFETGSLKNDTLYNKLNRQLDELGKKLNKFIQSVEAFHNNKYGNQLEESQENYETDFDLLISKIDDQKSNIK